MSEATNKVKWCLDKAKKELQDSNLHRGLVETEKDDELARRHITKAEHNLKAALYLEKGGFSDWSVSAFFYCIYHCFLAILIKFGYASRNQECTLAVIEMLKEEGKIDIDQKFIDALKIEKIEERQESNIIALRENFQYTADLDFKEKEKFNKLVEMCKEAINKTREIVSKTL
ncbi:MAG: HEPN domain-containing protein [Candidatus Woesearchaeota archaeon]|nr:HEPN domain-containing protein [Candidatus Woesearchaeota archaeon]